VNESLVNTNAWDNLPNDTHRTPSKFQRGEPYSFCEISKNVQQLVLDIRSRLLIAKSQPSHGSTKRNLSEEMRQTQSPLVVDPEVPLEAIAEDMRVTLGEDGEWYSNALPDGTSLMPRGG
jgi:hypothetical protein